MKEEPLLLVDRKPDPLELVVRAFCGALLGVLLGVYAWLRAASDFQPWEAGVFVSTIAAGSAFCSARYGDRYWEAVLSGHWPWRRG